MASTTALPPPTSLNKARGRATSPAGCVFAARPVPVIRLPAVFYCKACAGRIICRLFYCKACAGHSSAGCFATRPVPVSSPAGCFYDKACAGQLHHRPVLLQRPCLALSACLCLGPMPASPFCICPIHSLPCAPGSSRVLQGLPCRQPHHGTALAARAPFCCLSQHHRAFCRDCPVGSRTRDCTGGPCTACVHCAHFTGEA